MSGAGLLVGSGPLAAFAVPGTGFELPVEILILGLITGLTYSLLGLGLTLVYKTSRVLNFAHGEIGALPALLVPVLVINSGLNYWLALLASVALAALLGLVLEVTVIRRLRSASRLVVLVATIGVAQLLFLVNLLVPKGGDLGGSVYPTPFDVSVTIGNIRLGTGQLMILLLVPLIALALTWFFRRSRMGRASRAVAENAEVAQLAGVPIRRVSVAVWILAGLLAGVSAILIGPTRPIETQAALGPALLLRALGAAMLGGLTRMPAVFVGGIVIGVIEALILWNYPTGGVLEVVIFGIILLSLFLQRDLRQMARGGEGSSYSLAGRLRQLEPRIAAHPRVRLARRAGLVTLLALAVLLPLPFSSSERFFMSGVLVFAVIGLSLVVLTGFAGQVSLGQFAFVAVGAAVGGRLLQMGYPHPTAILYTVAAGGLVALVVGLPALRIRGLFLAVATLGFAVAASSWMFNQGWLVRTEGGVTSLRIERPEWLGISFESELNYYWLCLALLVGVAWAVRRLRSSGIGRAFLAVRDNEPSASTFSLSPRRVKLVAFVISGSIAAVGGFFYGGLLVNFADRPGSSTFGPEESLALVAMVVFGGVTTVTGAVLGAVWVRGMPHLFGSNIGLLSSGLGLLVILLLVPGGLASLAFNLRDRVSRWLARDDADVADRGPSPEGAPGAGEARESGEHPAAGAQGNSEAAEEEAAGITARLAATGRLSALTPRGAEDEGADAPDREDASPLAADDVRVRFGGNEVLRGVSLEARSGEIVGLMGPNGAGKTTLFDVLSGQIQPVSGSVLLGGTDVSSLPPQARAQLGLGRTFQQARLFDDLTVVDSLKIALEREDPSEVVPSLFGLPPSVRAERRKDLEASDFVDLLGLAPYAHRYVSELSTGIRRFTELGCVVAMGARVVLLDEPTAGFAQQEVESFQPVLREIRDYLGATMVVVDHDVPMMASLVDRLYVLVLGEVIAEGDPALLRDNEKVAEAYLGSSERAIERSGSMLTAQGT